MSTSSSSLNTPASRSPSPLTPEPSDSLDPVAIHTDLDIPASWYHHAMNHPKMAVPSWNSSPTVYTAPHKSEEDAMLHLDDLIEQHAFEDSPSSTFNSTPNYPSPSTTYNTNPSSPVPHSEPVVPDFRASNLLVPSRHGPISLTKPIPPPASMPRKTDPSAANQRVVHPPKESCYNLPIMFPSIPEGGTKSRVETQVRVTVDLADSNGDPNKYDRVGSWKWLKLPQGTATKKRTRKQGKIDPEPQEILHLTATVTCSSPPHARVLSCTSCQAREAKRVAKKLAARVRPARSDSESDGDHSGKPHKSKHHEDTTSIIQFNCAEVLDFSTGSVVLPLRITCYCRHHREKVGFNVHLAMMDHTGRIIGSGMSRPIMITDDHKTATANKLPELLGGFSTPATDHRDWSQVATPVNDSPPTATDARAPTRRKKDSVGSASALKKRPKPYDSTAKPNRHPREGSVSSAPSPSTSYSPLPMTRASTPSSSLQNAVQPEPEPPVGMAVNDSETSSPDTLATPLDNNSDVPMPQVTFELPDILQDLTQPLSQPHPTPAIPHSLSSSNMMTMQTIPHPMSFMFFGPNQNSQPLQLQLPTIHRLIPNMGPTHGGIEVTILGANFHPTLQLNCVFGDVAASSTQRWSDNTLVCILPPRAAPGVVAVWFDGFPKVDDQMQSPSSFFTYSDESDRALMELALQVVGLKMTGKIEDAKNVAMRIVGNTGPDGSDSSSNGNNGMMQLSMSPSVRALRPLLFVRACENDNYETRILDFLAVMETPMGHSAPSAISIAEAISYPSPSGQTLLHLAALLGFASLTTFLVRHGADVDARDRNGYTPLHFSALSKSSECATILLHAGADREIVNALGKTPEEIAIPQFFGAQSDTYDSESDDQRSDDEDADFGDGEEDEADVREIIIRRRNSRRSLRMQSNRSTPRRSANVSRAATPPPPPPPPPADEKKDLKAEDALDAADAKRAESFMEKMIQRTLAQIPAQGIIPNMPQLPLPNLPHLPDLPAVPWGALPQIPMVFPVFVPMMPGWPSFLGGEHGVPDNKAPVEGDETAPHMGAVALRAAQEWRATWEKWVALAVATTARQQTEELPPPVYTPRAPQSEGLQTIPEAEETKEEEVQEPVASTSSSSSRPHGSEIRPVGYDSTPVPDDVVESFGYQPNAKQTQKLQKKQDRMLVLFWLPILFVSMLWALHNGIRFAFHAVKLIIPAKVMRTV